MKLRKATKQQSFLAARSIMFWNSYPNAVEAPSLETFKNRFDKALERDTVRSYFELSWSNSIEWGSDPASLPWAMCTLQS